MDIRKDPDPTSRPQQLPHQQERETCGINTELNFFGESSSLLFLFACFFPSLGFSFDAYIDVDVHIVSCIHAPWSSSSVI